MKVTREEQDLMAMKVVGLRAALEARGDAVSGYGEQGVGTPTAAHSHRAVGWCARTSTWQRPRRTTGFSERAYTFNTRLTFNVLSEILVLALRLTF